MKKKCKLNNISISISIHIKELAQIQIFPTLYPYLITNNQMNFFRNEIEINLKYRKKIEKTNSALN